MATPQPPIITRTGISVAETKELAIDPWEFSAAPGTGDLTISEPSGLRSMYVNGQVVPAVVSEPPQAGTDQVGGDVWFPYEFKAPPAVIAAVQESPSLVAVRDVTVDGFRYDQSISSYQKNTSAYGGKTPRLISQLATGQTMLLTGVFTSVAVWIVDLDNQLLGPLSISVPYPLGLINATAHVTLANGLPCIYMSTIQSTMRLHAFVASDEVPNASTVWTVTTMYTIANTSGFSGIRNISVLPSPYVADGWVMAFAYTATSGNHTVTMNVAANGYTVSDINVQTFPTATTGNCTLGQVPGQNKFIIAATGAASEGFYMRSSTDFVNWSNVNAGVPVFLGGNTWNTLTTYRLMSTFDNKLAMLGQIKGTTTLQMATSSNGDSWTITTLPAAIGGIEGFASGPCRLFEHGSADGLPVILSSLGSSGPPADYKTEYWVASDAVGTTWVNTPFPFSPLLAPTSDEYVGAKEIFLRGYPVLAYQPVAETIGFLYPAERPITWHAIPITT